MPPFSDFFYSSKTKSLPLDVHLYHTTVCEDQKKKKNKLGNPNLLISTKKCSPEGKTYSLEGKLRPKSFLWEGVQYMDIF